MPSGLLLAVASILSVTVCTAAPGGWAVAKSEHFEVYSRAGAPQARATLDWLEQVRAFFAGQTGFKLDDRPAVRVIAFRSKQEYDAYRLRPLADAFYVGTVNRDYIVLSSSGPDLFRAAAHEYVHAVVHAMAAELPRWMNDGLAEVFSTIRFTDRETLIGGEVPLHRRALRSRPWIPTDRLLAKRGPDPLDRGEGTIFYAQSWALTHMLLLSPDYTHRFPDLAAALLGGTPGPVALPAIYGRALDEIARDARAWVERGPFSPVRLPAVERAASTPLLFSEITRNESQLVLADLLVACGELERADALYAALEREGGEPAAVAAGRGLIALQRGQTGAALQHLRRAMEHGIGDARIYYRYAEAAEAAGLPEAAVRSALERAIQLKPDYDDARFRLALSHANAGRFEAALAQLDAVRIVRRDRAHAYWRVKADALIQLGRRKEAVHAAERAAAHASDASEQRHAEQLSYIAMTDLVVRFTRDAEGRLQLATTRAPHDRDDWNPFIEPGDRIRRAQARLVTIECGDGATSISVETASGPLRLAIPNPAHVQMRNAPAEFTCGPQPANPVTVVYAATDRASSGNDGVVRGIEFH